MDYQTQNLILHLVTEDDLAEVAGKWPADCLPIMLKWLTDKVL